VAVHDVVQLGADLILPVLEAADLAVDCGGLGESAGVVYP